MPERNPRSEQDSSTQSASELPPTRRWSPPPKTAEPEAAVPESARPAPPGETSQLVISRGPGTGARFDLTAARTTLGRHPDNDIVLDHVTVSRQHAVIQRDGDCFAVVDADSLNGTYLNRNPVEHAWLADGDEIQIGIVRLTVWLSERARLFTPHPR
jgi:pSer/pThr/pTyr-binding forkhead associated (FHA) protein